MAKSQKESGVEIESQMSAQLIARRRSHAGGGHAKGGGRRCAGPNTGSNDRRLGEYLSGSPSESPARVLRGSLSGEERDRVRVRAGDKNPPLSERVR